MNTNIKAFMKPDLKERGTMEFPGIDKFCDEKGKPIPFIIRRMSSKEVKEIRDMYRSTSVFRDKTNNSRPIIGNNGQVAVLKDYDAEKAGADIMVSAFVQPKLDDSELMESYGVYDRLDMPDVIFADRKDYEYANECLMEALGIREQKDEKEIIDEVKN